MFDEVIKKGSEQGYPDAIELKDLYKKELVVLKKPKNVDKRIEKVKSLHLGEVEAISLALEYENTEILLDDEEARVFARNMGIKVKGALGLLVENYKKQLISRTEAKESLRKLNELMYL